MPIGLESLALSVAVAIASGLVGCFAVMRRMTLAADALSHVALPGIGLALLLHLHPLAGAMVALFLGTVLIWLLETRTRISVETIVGVVFSTSLAVGAMITTGEELIDALFGGAGRLGPWESLFGLLAAAAVVAFVLLAKSRLVIALISPEIARTAGIDVPRLNLAFLLAFALTVGLGLRYLGVLLMGSLIIIPAATARRVARNLGMMFSVAAGVAVFATVAGTQIAARLSQQSGPIIIVLAAGCFFSSLLLRRGE